MSFIQFIRHSKSFEEMLQRRPTAFCLFALIAYRARWASDASFDDLEIGEALLGDHQSYGVSRQNYRTDLKFLEKFNFLTTRVTNKGTVAKIIDTSIFDINANGANHQDNQRLTSDQPATNQRLTTKEKDNKDNKEKKENKRVQSPQEILSCKKTIEELKERFPQKDVEGELEKMKDYITSTGKKYKDYLAFARNWLRRAEPGRGGIRDIDSSGDTGLQEDEVVFDGNTSICCVNPKSARKISGRVENE